MDVMDSLTVEHRPNNSYPEEDIDILVECLGVEKSGLTGYKLCVFDQHTRVARIEYYLFETDNIGYVGWLEVSPDWRQNGIATEIRQRAVTHLRDAGATEIWSGPVTHELHSTLERQGFEKADIKYSDYYVSR